MRLLFKTFFSKLRVANKAETCHVKVHSYSPEERQSRCKIINLQSSFNTYRQQGNKTTHDLSLLTCHINSTSLSNCSHCPRSTQPGHPSTGNHNKYWKQTYRYYEWKQTRPAMQWPGDRNEKFRITQWLGMLNHCVEHNGLACWTSHISPTIQLISMNRHYWLYCPRQRYHIIIFIFMTISTYLIQTGGYRQGATELWATSQYWSSHDTRDLCQSLTSSDWAPVSLRAGLA